MNILRNGLAFGVFNVVLFSITDLKPGVFRLLNYPAFQSVKIEQVRSIDVLIVVVIVDVAVLVALVNCQIIAA